MADGYGSTIIRADVMSDAQTRLLTDNLDPKHVRQREQSGKKFSYIEGWQAIKEANRIFGFGGWDRHLLRLEETNRDLVELTKDGRKYKQWRVGYLATVRVAVYGEGGARFRDGTGFGTGMGREDALGDAIESAVKEAETDAMKRALSTFGNPFGLALYDKTRAEVGPSRNTDAYHEPDADDMDDDPVAPPAPPPHRQTSNVPGGMSAGSVGREFERNVANGDEPGLTISERAKPKSAAEQAAEKAFKILEADLNATDSKAALNAWLTDNKAACAALPEPFKSDIRTLVGQHFAHWKRLSDEAEDYAARIAEEANREFAQ